MADSKKKSFTVPEGADIPGLHDGAVVEVWDKADDFVVVAYYEQVSGVKADNTFGEMTVPRSLTISAKDFGSLKASKTPANPDDAE